MTRFKYMGFALLVAAFMPLAIWAAAGSALYHSRKEKQRDRATSCSTGTDCPPGYLCFGGQCVPEGPR